MTESFRPIESASIAPDLRTRLEGTVELLEDAFPLLDSLMDLLARAENSKDDVATLHECVNQLPRIDEAIDKANKHEQAIALTQAVGARKHRALLAANERLAQLRREEQPSLRAALGVLLDLLKRQGTPPRPDEDPLMKAGGPPWAAALGLGAATAMIIWIASEGAGFAALLGALVTIMILMARSGESQWVLLPDRLFFPATWPELSSEVAPSAIVQSKAQSGMVLLELANGEKTLLRSDDPERFVMWLRLLGSTWLSTLKSPANAFELIDAVDDATQAKGRALISKEGVLFVRPDRTSLVVGALAGTKLPKVPTLDEVLGLIAHLPEGRWNALGEHLVQVADAIWISSDDASVDENLVQASERRVRLLLTNNPRRVGAEKLLKAF